MHNNMTNFDFQQAGTEPYPLFLASASKARADLLNKSGYIFTVIKNGGEEGAVGCEEPHRHTLERALHKGISASLEVNRGVIIAADTIAFCQGRIIGKPKDHEDALNTLRLLCTHPHLVISGIVVVEKPSGQIIAGTDATKVYMRNMSDAEIRHYVESGEAMGKAGSYAVQETGDRYIERMEGSYSNVVGLPMKLLAKMLDILANKGIVLKS